MESKQFLVKYGTSSKIISITNPDNITHVIKETFCLNSSDDILVQRYDKVWDDFIDVEDLTQLNNLDKLKCTLKTNEVERDPDYTIYLNDSSSSTTESSSLSLPVPSELWPSEFKLPEEKFSTLLKYNLEKELPLNWGCKRELLGIIVDKIFTYKIYPNSYEITVSAKCLIESYPYLAEKIGSGYDRWLSSIRDKMKNVRRKMNLPIVSSRKRKPKAVDQNEAKLKRKKIAHGTNAFPPITVEDDVSAEELVEEMKTEMKNPQRSISMIQLSMEKTYAYRRQLVNECAPVRVLLNKYPSLKMVEAMSEEMCRVTGKSNLRETFDKNCTSYSTGILELAKKKKTEYAKNTCKTLDDTLNDLVEPNPVDVSRIQTITAIILLAEVLGEDNREFVHIYDCGTSLDECTEGPRTPHLAVVGSIDKPVAVHTVIEGEITCTVKNLLEAVYVTFCAYYIYNIEYPKAALNTWSFVQFVLCGIEEGEKPPKKVISLRGKLMDSKILVDLPDVVIVHIFHYIGLAELITTVNRVCRCFYNLIKHSPVLWTSIEFDNHVSITNKDQLTYLLNHSMKFQTFLFGFNSLNVDVSDIDFLFTFRLSKAISLYWLDLSGCRLSTLCFVKRLSNLKIINLSECRNLVNDDFKVLTSCSNLDQVYVSFTKIKANTVVELGSVLKLIVLDVCGVQLSIEDCETILQHSYETLLFLHISILGPDIDEESVNTRLKDVYIDTSIKVQGSVN